MEKTLNKAETTKLLTMLASVWSNETIDDAKITAYQMALEDVSYGSAMQACKTLFRSAKFFPKPSEIFDLVSDAADPPKSTGECWDIVQKQIRKHGYQGWADVDFGDDVILAAVKMVGWRRLCYDEDQTFIRRDFDQALEVCQERHRRDIQSGAVALPSTTGGEIVQLPRKAS